MGRPIDARYLIKHWDSTKSMVDNIDAAPTLDVAPVVHAYWKDNGANFKCSACGMTERYNDYSYCHYCGAKMDEVTE